MRIVSLIGPPGSGKSAVGQILADKLVWTFLDTDILIENRQRLSVQDIFEQLGEVAFREMENNLLLDLANNPKGFLEPGRSGIVIATGGGLPCQGNNFQVLAKMGELVTLEAALEILVTRVKTKNNRPLLNHKQHKSGIDKTSDELQGLLANLIKQREDVYRQPQYKIDTSILSPEQACAEIIRLLRLS